MTWVSTDIRATVPNMAMHPAVPDVAPPAPRVMAGVGQTIGVLGSRWCKGERMASIRMVAENEAVGRVKAIYQEIKEQFGIDFVPNLYKVMASNPGYLEANWNKVKAVMFASGKLDRLTKEIIAVAVSAVQGCRY